ncbi:MAG: DUF1501 domain-containing protein, partial [Planctomycetota bacterium]
MDDNLDRMVSRRTFLRRGSCAALGLAGLTSQMLTMRSIAAAVDGLVFPDYRALVCVFMFGGNDNGNTLIPWDGGNENHADYARERSTLALTAEQLAGTIISPRNTSGRRFAFHPAMADLHGLFEGGNLSVLSNVGTLLHPVTKAQYASRTVPLPSQLFSHDDQQEQWQLSRPDATDGVGWGGRIADLLQASGASADSGVSMNISLAGTSTFMSGRSVVPYSVGRSGVSVLNTSNLGSSDERSIVKQALLDMYAAGDDPSQPNRNAMRSAVSDVAGRAVVTADLLDARLDEAPIATTVPPGNSLASQLATVAKLIQVSESTLGHRRQIFFVAVGGFDNHDGLIGTDATDGAHAGRLREVNDALKFFWDELGAINKRRSVTTFTASDFGRTYDSNGDGSDHGWGSDHLVMGGAQLRGQRIFGAYPTIQEDSLDDVGRG